VNVEATRQLAEIARARGVRRLIFTSTTALYGNAIVPGSCAWINEDVCPEPRTVYHHTKLAAECILEKLSCPSFQVRVIRMSRCFPEPAPLMAAYRLHRGVDARDVADTHRLAIIHSGPAFRCFLVSARTPFRAEDCALLAENAPAVINVKAPELASAFAARSWGLPTRIDRIYDSTRAQHELGWKPRFGFEEILADLDRGSSEVLLP
jgi:nucleoside-diphosphate-sugar epimerase